jgi:hypothetical protein
MYYVIVGLFCFCAGFFCAGLMAEAKRRDEEMDKAMSGSWE